MKKFIQYTAVLGAVLTVLGFGTASAAHIHGGRWTQMQVWRDVIHGRKERGYRVPATADTGTMVEERTRSFPCLPEFSIEVDFGNVVICADEGIEEILICCESGTDFNRVVWPYAEDGEIKLIVYGKRGESYRPTVEVIVPAGYRFQEMEIELGSGSCTVEGIKAVEFSAETGGGDLLVENGAVSSLELRCAAGNISWNGQTTGSTDIDCAAGSITYCGQMMGNVEADCAAGNIYLELPWQKETDFNYELDGTGGSIQVGEKSFSGVVFSKENYQGAPRTMELQSAAGSIQVVFGGEEITVEELPFREVEIWDTGD